MGLKEDIALFSERLDNAVNLILVTHVLPAAKKELKATISENVYGAYTPESYHRRGTNGGLLDMSEVEYNLDEGDHTLYIQDAATGNWNCGDLPGVVIADVIAAGEPFTWFGSGKHPVGGRPFHEDAERRFAESGKFAASLMKGLRGLGL